MTVVEILNTNLEVGVKVMGRGPKAAPPVHGEVPFSMTNPLLERKAIVNKKEELSTPEYSPVTKVALTLPNISPVFSIRAIPSRQGRDESQPSHSVVPGQSKSVICSFASHEATK